MKSVMSRKEYWIYTQVCVCAWILYWRLKFFWSNFIIVVGLKSTRYGPFDELSIWTNSCAQTFFFYFFFFINFRCCCCCYCSMEEFVMHPLIYLYISRWTAAEYWASTSRKKKMSVSVWIFVIFGLPISGFQTIFVSSLMEFLSFIANACKWQQPPKRQAHVLPMNASMVTRI